MMMPIDDIELGLAGLNFEAITELRRQDAKAQETLVDLIACCLEQTCLTNDAKQVGKTDQSLKFLGCAAPMLSWPSRPAQMEMAVFQLKMCDTRSRGETVWKSHPKKLTAH
jgi:hypothetical protein